METYSEKRYSVDLDKLAIEQYQHFVVNGVDCVIYRHRLGYLTGYVVIDATLNANYEELFDVHGGITYQGPLDKVVNIPEVNGHCIGFHADHANDWSPSCREGIYRDYDYIHNELTSLARQYAAWKKQFVNV